MCAIARLCARRKLLPRSIAGAAVERVARVTAFQHALKAYESNLAAVLARSSIRHWVSGAYYAVNGLRANLSNECLRAAPRTSPYRSGSRRMTNDCVAFR